MQSSKRRTIQKLFKAAFIVAFFSTTALLHGSGNAKACDVKVFDRELRDALGGSNAGQIALMVSYPLRINDSRGSYFIKDAASLQGRLDDIFTPAVRRVIANEQLRTATCDPVKFMYGNGEVWVDSTQQGYAITAINVPGGEEQARAVTDRVEFTCRTDEYRVIVDRSRAEKLRFRAWDKGHPLTQKADIEVLNGEKHIEGTGSCAYPEWSFVTGGQRFVVEGLGCLPESGSDAPPATATGRLVLSTDRTRWCF